MPQALQSRTQVASSRSTSALNPQEFESRTCFAATVTGWSQAEQGHLMGVPAIDVGRGVQRLRTTLSMIVKMPPPSGSSR
jgi:hypothetical protein